MVHVFRADTAAAIRWAKLARVPTVYTEAQEPPQNTEDYNAGFYALLRKTIGGAHAVIAPSQAVRLALQSFCRDSRISVIPWIVACGEQAPRVRSRETHPVVAYTGRLSPEKGISYLLLAARMVVSQYPKVRFDIWGSGPQAQALQAQARELELNGSVTFKGTYDGGAELDRVMLDIDVLVLPSLTEGLPISVIEAMAYAKPVVATAVGGNPEVVADGVNGLLVPPRDPRALAQALCYLLESEEYRRRMGSAGRRRYEANYTENVVTSQIVALYRRVLGEIG